MAASDWEAFQEYLEGLTAARIPEELQEELAELDELLRLALDAEKAGKEAKTQELRQVVDTHLRHNPDEKLLIFTEFKDTLTALERRFREWGLPCAVIHGQMGMEARIDQERRFRDDVQVMIGTDAAGEGINLQFCRMMVNYDLPWSPNRLEQRMGRIHRYGQTRDCFVFNMLYPETCEGRVLQKLMEKLEKMKERLGDTVYDVIAEVLGDVRLEDLIMQAVVAGEEAEPERALDDVNVEERLEAFRRALEENALAGHHIDLSGVQRDQGESLLQRLVPWDVERFTRLAVRTVGGQFVEDRQHTGIFRISVPREFLKQRGLQDEAFALGLRVAFERETARRAGAEFFAPGHPLLEALVDHFLRKDRPARTVLVDEKGRRGALLLYWMRLQDGRGQPALERLIAFFHDFATGETRQVDPRVLWDLEPPPEDLSLPEDLTALLNGAGGAARQEALEHLDAFQKEAQARRERECAIKERWLRASCNELIRESQDKLFAYHRRRDAGEDMDAAIRQEEENLKALVREQRERLAELEKERQVDRLEPELVAVAVILPKPPASPEGPGAEEEARHRVEEAGMRVAMEYERNQGWNPVDVSRDFLGYDIHSTSPTGTRYIEVKAFATTGPLELTPHEWQMARRLGEAYWLYVVEDALTAPRLHRIPDPARRYQPQAAMGVVKLVIEDWKGDSER